MRLVKLIKNSSAKKKNKCKNCAVCCYSVLRNYNLYNCAYPNLTAAYKYLLTLSITQVSCERSFSTLKYIFNRLRSSLSQDHIDAFMLMAVEKEILYSLSNEEIIDCVAKSSKLLRSFLMP